MSNRLIRSRKISTLLLLVCCFMLISSVLTSPTDWWDTWFHLKTGEMIIKNHHLLTTDIFSFTGIGKSYFAHEWLSQVIFFITHNTLGLFGLKIIVWLIASGSLGLILYYLNSKKVNAIIAVVYVTLLAIITSPFWQPRPQIFGFFFLAILMVCFQKYYDQPKKLLPAAAIISFIWANFHGSVIIVPLIALFYSLIGAIQKKHIRLAHILLPLITFIATLLNPSTTRLYTYIFEKNIYTLSKNVAEFQSIFVYKNEFVPVLFFIFFTIALLFSLYMVISKHITIPAEKIALASSLVVLLLPFASYRLLPLSVIIFSVLSAPMMLCRLGEAVAKAILSKSSQTITLSVIILCALFFCITYLSGASLMQPDMSYFPVNAASFIQSRHIKGAAYNPYDWGGYLLWRLGPDFKVFVDGRMDIYAQTDVPQALDNLFGLLNDKNSDYEKIRSSWTKLLNAFAIEHVVIHTGQDRTLGELTLQEEGWSLIYFDSVASILTRDKSLKSDTDTLSAIDPFSISPYKAGRINDALNQYEKYAQTYPENTFALTLYAIALTEHGEYSSAEKILHTVTDKEPDNAAAFYNLGLVYVGKKDYQNALINFERAFHEDKTYAAAYKNAAKISLEMIPDRKKAIKYYRRYINLNPADPEHDTIVKIIRELES